MHQLGLHNETTILLQHFLNVLIGILQNLSISKNYKENIALFLRNTNLDILASKVGNLSCEAALFINRARQKSIGLDNTIFNTNTVIVLTKSRSVVDNAGTGIISNVSIAHDFVAFALEFLGEVLEHWYVFPTVHLCALESLQDCKLGLLGILVQHIQTLFEQDVLVTGQLILDLDVFKVGMNTETQVGWKGPRRGSPCKNLSTRITDKWETDDNYLKRIRWLARRGRVSDAGILTSWVVHILVVLRGLKVGQWGMAGSRVRHDLSKRS